MESKANKSPTNKNSTTNNVTKNKPSTQLKNDSTTPLEKKEGSLTARKNTGPPPKKQSFRSETKTLRPAKDLNENGKPVSSRIPALNGTASNSPKNAKPQTNGPRVERKPIPNTNIKPSRSDRNLSVVNEVETPRSNPPKESRKVPYTVSEPPRKRGVNLPTKHPTAPRNRYVSPDRDPELRSRGLQQVSQDGAYYGKLDKSKAQSASTVLSFDTEMLDSGPNVSVDFNNVAILILGTQIHDVFVLLKLLCVEQKHMKI